MTPIHFVYALPVLCLLVLFVVLRNDSRRKVIENRLAGIKRVATDETPPEPRISRLRQAASRGLSVTMLFPREIRVYLDRAFETAGNRIGILHLLIAALVAAVVSNVFASRVLTLEPIWALLLTIAAACLLPLIVLRMAQSRYRNSFLDVFPDALDLIGRAVKAGLPVNEALVVAGQETADPVGKEIRRTTEQVQFGVPMVEALEKTAERVRIADFQFMVVALALQAKTGGSLAETLTNLSSVIRGRKSLRLKIRGLTAEAKVSALVLAALPFIVGGLMFVMNRDLLMPLFVDARGRFMTGVSFVSLASGLIMMYVMIKRAVR